MSHFVAYILQFQEIIVSKIPPGGGGGSIASLRSNCEFLYLKCPTTLIIPYLVLAIVQLKRIFGIREAFCTGIQLLIAIIDAEEAEKVTLTFEGHRM